MSDSLLALDLRIRLQCIGDRQLAQPGRQRTREHPLDVAVDDPGESHVTALDGDAVNH